MFINVLVVASINHKCAILWSRPFLFSKFCFIIDNPNQGRKEVWKGSPSCSRIYPKGDLHNRTQTSMHHQSFLPTCNWSSSLEMRAKIILVELAPVLLSIACALISTYQPNNNADGWYCMKCSFQIVKAFVPSLHPKQLYHYTHIYIYVDVCIH